MASHIILPGGFLNQADRLIIELRQRRQPSMEECIIPVPGGENITQRSLVVRSCWTRATSQNNCCGTLHHSQLWSSTGLTIIEYRASNTADQSHQQPYCLISFCLLCIHTGCSDWYGSKECIINTCKPQRKQRHKAIPTFLPAGSISNYMSELQQEMCLKGSEKYNGGKGIRMLT